MFTSDKKRNNVRRTYLAATVLTAVFGAVYELFGHGVYSYAMLYAFLVPLCGAMLFEFAACDRFGSKVTEDCFHGGLAVLTVGCLIKGVMDIYGTASPMLAFYWSSGAVLLGIGLTGLFGKRRASEAAGKKEQIEQKMHWPC